VRDDILTDLRSQGWLAARKGETGVSIISHPPRNDLRNAPERGPERDAHRIGIVDNQESIDTSVEQFIDYGRIASGPEALMLEFSGEDTRADRPGVAVLFIRLAEPIRFDLPPSATPRECAELVHGALTDLGHVILGRDHQNGTCSSTVIDVFDARATIYASIVSGLTGRRGDRGVQAWSVGIAVQDGELVDFSTAGTVAADVNDDPPGLRDTGFESYSHANPEDNRGLRGVRGATVLSFIRDLALPPRGTEPFLALTISPSLEPQHTGEIVTVRHLFGVSSLTSLSSQSVTIGGEGRNAGMAGAVLLHFRSDIFRRGDVNSDGTLNLSDGVSILRYKFLGVSFGDCISAADVNDSGSINTSDAISLFQYLYLGGPAPLPPLECDGDPTPDLLSCASFPACD
jgi:hypothetical protein